MANPPPRGPSSEDRAGEPRPGRSPFQAFLYWTLVMGVWALIFIVAFFAVFSVDLPDTSKLYDVKRQPSISYLDRSGGLVAVRGSQYAPPVDLDKLPPYVPKAFIAIEDRWYYWRFGFNPGHRAGRSTTSPTTAPVPSGAARPSPSNSPARCS